MKTQHLALIVLALLIFGGPASRAFAGDKAALPPVLRNKVCIPSLMQMATTVPDIRPCHVADGQVKPDGNFKCTLWADTKQDMVFWFAVHDPKTMRIRGVYELTGKGQRKVWPE